MILDLKTAKGLWALSRTRQRTLVSPGKNLLLLKFSMYVSLYYPLSTKKIIKISENPATQVILVVLLRSHVLLHSWRSHLENVFSEFS